MANACSSLSTSITHAEVVTATPRASISIADITASSGREMANTSATRVIVVGMSETVSSMASETTVVLDGVADAVSSCVPNHEASTGMDRLNGKLPEGVVDVVARSSPSTITLTAQLSTKVPLSMRRPPPRTSSPRYTSSSSSHNTMKVLLPSHGISSSTSWAISSCNLSVTSRSLSMDQTRSFGRKTVRLSTTSASIPSA